MSDFQSLKIIKSASQIEGDQCIASLVASDQDDESYATTPMIISSCLGTLYGREAGPR